MGDLAKNSEKKSIYIKMWEFDDLLDEVDKIYNKNGSNKQVNGTKSNLNTSSSVIIDKSKKENLQP